MCSRQRRLLEAQAPQSYDWFSKQSYDNKRGNCYCQRQELKHVWNSMWNGHRTIAIVSAHWWVDRCVKCSHGNISDRKCLFEYFAKISVHIYLCCRRSEWTFNIWISLVGFFCSLRGRVSWVSSSVANVVHMREFHKWTFRSGMKPMIFSRVLSRHVMYLPKYLQTIVLHTPFIQYDFKLQPLVAAMWWYTMAKCCLSSAERVNNVWCGSMKWFQCMDCGHRDADVNCIWHWPTVCTIARLGVLIASSLNIECYGKGICVFPTFCYSLMFDDGLLTLNLLRSAICGTSKCITADRNCFFKWFPRAICSFVGLVSCSGNCVEYVVRDFDECFDVGADFPIKIASSRRFVHHVIYRGW